MSIASPAFRKIERSNPTIDSSGLEFATVKSRTSSRSDVVVPPQARGKRDLRIVILLHGAYGSHWAWTFKGAARTSK